MPDVHMYFRVTAPPCLSEPKPQLVSMMPHHRTASLEPVSQIPNGILHRLVRGCRRRAHSSGLDTSTTTMMMMMMMMPSPNVYCPGNRMCGEKIYEQPRGGYLTSKKTSVLRPHSTSEMRSPFQIPLAGDKGSSASPPNCSSSTSRKVRLLLESVMDSSLARISMNVRSLRARGSCLWYRPRGASITLP